MTPTTSPKPLFLKARLLAFVFGLGLLVGPAFGAFKLFTSEPSKFNGRRPAMTVSDAQETKVLLGVVIVPFVLILMYLGGFLVRMSVSRSATESDIRTDPEAPSFADSALICMHEGLGGGSAVIVDREAGMVHFRQCHYPPQPSLFPKAQQWHSCSIQGLLQASRDIEIVNDRKIESFVIKTPTGQAIATPAMANYEALCKALESPISSQDELLAPASHRRSSSSEQPLTVADDDEDEPTQPLTTATVNPRETSKGTIPAAPFGVSLRHTESGWELTAPITSNGTAIVSGMLLALSAYGMFQLLSSIGFDFLVVGIGLGAMSAIGWQCARGSWGILRITCHGNHLTIFEGVGSLGSTQTFDATRMPEINKATVTRKYAIAKVIRLSGNSEIQFGELLSDEHREYIRTALYRLLLDQKKM